jgi:hypothetical protein
MTVTHTATVQSIDVPGDWPLPVRHFDSQTGQLDIVEGTIEALEDVNDLDRGTITDDVFGYILMAWYRQRRQAGDPPHSVMEKLKHAREIRTLH